MEHALVCYVYHIKLEFILHARMIETSSRSNADSRLPIASDLITRHYSATRLQFSELDILMAQEKKTEPAIQRQMDYSAPGQD